MYYLQSRYYDPAIGRFINADVFASTGQGIIGTNMFAYCGNNPIARADDGGEFWHIIAGAVVGAVVSFTTSVVGDVLAGKEVDWAAAGISAAFGAVGGALASTGLGAAAQIAGGAVLAGAENAISQGREKGFNNINYGEVAISAVIGGVSSSSNGVSTATARHLNRQGINATKRVLSSLKDNGIKSIGRTIRATSRYYVSQTSTLFYKPLISDAFSTVTSSVGRGVLRQLTITAS